MADLPYLFSLYSNTITLTDAHFSFMNAFSSLFSISEQLALQIQPTGSPQLLY